MTLRIRLIASLAIAASSITAVATAQETNYLCFMQRASGQMIDLTALCVDEALPALSANRASSPASQTQPTSIFRDTTQAAGLTKVGDGKGGYVNRGIAHDFAYELWTNQDNTSYNLKVWELKGGKRTGQVANRTFESSREALNYFDCTYGGKEELCNLR